MVKEPSNEFEDCKSVACSDLYANTTTPEASDEFEKAFSGFISLSLVKILKDFKLTSGGGLHEIGKGSVRAAIASEGYLSDAEVRLHNMHVHDQLLIAKDDEHVEEISMKQ